MVLLTTGPPLTTPITLLTERRGPLGRTRQLLAELAAVHRRVAELEARAERAVELESELSFVRQVCSDAPRDPGLCVGGH